ncbi:ATP-binding protein, partial [Streptomyces sp. NPDC001130]
MLLERQNELKVAAEALRLAVHGSGSLVVISGPPGIGKSALLTEIGELASRLPIGPITESLAPPRPLVMRAYAAPTERDFALGVTRQLLSPVLTSGSFVGPLRFLIFGAALRADSTNARLASLVARLISD